MRAFVLFFLLFAPPVVAADFSQTVQTALEETILPAHRLLEKAGKELSLATARECTDIRAIFLAYHTLFDRWQYLQFLSFGPVEQFNRGQRLHFWPDRKNSVARQTMEILKKGEIDKIEGERAVVASVAIQGLPSLEALLYPQAGKAAAALDAVQCRMAQAIAANLAAITEELDQDWQGPEGHARAMLAPGQGKSPYGDSLAAASRLYNALLGQIETVLTLKLERVLAKKRSEARPERGESVLSERSLRNLKYNMQGMRESFAPSARGGFVAALRQRGHDALAEKSLAAFEAVDKALALVPEPLEKAVVTQGGWKKLDAVRKKLKILQHILTQEVGPTLGMQFGFNALDGDGG